MRKLALLAVLVPLVAFATYMHVTNLSSSGTSTSYTFTAVPVDGRIAVQCHGGDARLAFGTTSATAVSSQGVRIIADSPPEPVQLLGTQDTVAMVPDENAPAGTVKCTITTASVR